MADDDDTTASGGERLGAAPVDDALALRLGRQLVQPYLTDAFDGLEARARAGDAAGVSPADPLWQDVAGAVQRVFEADWYDADVSLAQQRRVATELGRLLAEHGHRFLVPLGEIRVEDFVYIEGADRADDRLMTTAGFVIDDVYDPGRGGDWLVVESPVRAGSDPVRQTVLVPDDALVLRVPGPLDEGRPGWIDREAGRTAERDTTQDQDQDRGAEPVNDLAADDAEDLAYADPAGEAPEADTADIGVDLAEPVVERATIAEITTDDALTRGEDLIVTDAAAPRSAEPAGELPLSWRSGWLRVQPMRLRDGEWVTDGEPPVNRRARRDERVMVWRGFRDTPTAAAEVPPEPQPEQETDLDLETGADLELGADAPRDGGTELADPAAATVEPEQEPGRDQVVDAPAAVVDGPAADIAPAGVEVSEAAPTGGGEVAAEVEAAPQAQALVDPLAGFSPADAARVRVAVENYASRHYRESEQELREGETAAELAARRVDETVQGLVGRRLGELVDQYGEDQVRAGVAAVIAGNPTLLRRSPQQVARYRQQRNRDAERLATRAGEANRGHRYEAARRLVDEGEQTAPDYQASHRYTWDDLRGRISEAETAAVATARRGGQLDGIDPETPARARVSVEDHAHQYADQVADDAARVDAVASRITTEHLGEVAATYGRPLTTALAAGQIDARPEVLGYTQDQVAVNRQARGEQVQQRCAEALTLADAGNPGGAVAKLREAAVLDPDYPRAQSGKSWAEVRRPLEALTRQSQKTARKAVPVAGVSHVGVAMARHLPTAATQRPATQDFSR